MRPLFDADGMRAIDRWAIEEQGVPSLELMEAAGRRWPTAVAALAPQGAGTASSAARATTAATAWLRPGASSARASRSRRWRSSATRFPPTSTPGWRAPARSSTRSSAPASRARRAEPAHRRSTRSTAAGRRSSPATSPPASTPRPARSRAAVEAAITVTFHAAKLGHRVAPGKARRGAAGRADRHPRRRAGRAGGRHDRAGGARPGAAPRRHLDQVQLRPGHDRRRLARADRRGADVLAGRDPGRRRLRDRRRPGRPRGGLRAGGSRR